MCFGFKDSKKEEVIEKVVVESYKKIEEGAVEGFQKVSDKFVEKLFTKEDETIEEAKERLSSSLK